VVARTERNDVIATTTCMTIPRPSDREAWLAARRIFYNASVAAALFNEHPFTNLTNVIAAKLDPALEGVENSAMRRGAHLEAGIASWWSEEHGIAVYEPDVIYVRGEIAATLDRRIVGNDTDCLEIKTTSKHVVAPERYWVWQCQAQMYPADLERVHLAVLDASLALQTFVVPRDDAAIARLVERAHEVMAFVNVGEWPPSVPRDDEGRAHTDNVVELDDNAREHLSAWLAAKEEIADLERIELAHKEALIEILGDAGVATIDGAQVLTYRAHRRTNIDLQRLRAEHAQLAEELSVSTLVRVLRPVAARGERR
jgi:predicted phage-related endonuclease